MAATALFAVMFLSASSKRAKVAGVFSANWRIRAAVSAKAAVAAPHVETAHAERARIAQRHCCGPSEVLGFGCHLG